MQLFHDIIYEIKMYKNMIQDTKWVFEHYEELSRTYPLGRTVCIKNEEILAVCLNELSMPQELWSIDGIVQINLPFHPAGHLGKIHFTWKWDNANVLHRIRWYRTNAAPFSRGVWKLQALGGELFGGHWMHTHICIKPIS